MKSILTIFATAILLTQSAWSVTSEMKTDDKVFIEEPNQESPNIRKIDEQNQVRPDRNPINQLEKDESKPTAKKKALQNRIIENEKTMRNNNPNPLTPRIK